LPALPASQRGSRVPWGDTVQVLQQARHATCPAQLTGNLGTWKELGGWWESPERGRRVRSAGGR